MHRMYRQANTLTQVEAMPFDAEVSVRAAHLFDIEPKAPDLTAAMIFAGDPDLEWARANPDRLLAFLYVSPRPCAALDDLLSR
jgi:hypothetical protein